MMASALTWRTSRDARAWGRGAPAQDGRRRIGRRPTVRAADLRERPTGPCVGRLPCWEPLPSSPEAHMRRYPTATTVAILALAASAPALAKVSYVVVTPPR